MKQKNRAIFAAVLAALALLAVPVLAWLYMQRSMETITKINSPMPFSSEPEMQSQSSSWSLETLMFPKPVTIKM